MKFGIKFWHLICLVSAGAFYLAFIWKNSFLVGHERYFSLLDDAMVAMRYAKNLADGYGLRWNPGEPAVEGYTNLLWTLYMAVIHWLPIAMSKTSLVVMLSGAGILLANLVVVKKLTEAIAGENSYAPLLAVFLTAFYYPLVYWTLRGMEVGLLCLLVNYAILCAFRLYDRYSLGDVIKLTMTLVAALLTRPDMVVPIGVVGIFLLYVIRKSGIKFSYAIIPVGIVAVACGLTLFRIKYYGDPVPNTYYLKVAGVTASERASRGMSMLAELFGYHLWPILLLVAVAFWKNASLRRCPKLILLLGMFLGQSVYSVYVGGDAWEWLHFSNRYIAIAVPALFVVVSVFLSDPETVGIKTLSVCLPALGAGLFAEGIYYFRVDTRELPTAGVGLAGLFIVVAGIWMGVSSLRRRRIASPVFAAVVTLIAGVALNFFGISNWVLKTNNGGLLEADALAVREGLALRQVTTPTARIAYIAAGAMPYFAGRKAIDLLGKSDPVIAKGKPAAPFFPGHSKWNYAYSIGQLKPDLVTSLWAATGADKKNMADWGYLRCDYGYYLKDSTNINRAILETSAP
jgi:hypothetical protein